MDRFLNPGNSGFQKIIVAEVYVDKTGNEVVIRYKKPTDNDD